MENDSNTYGNITGLSPAFVAGADPGSTYKVMVRTAHGYVGVRRLSKYVYKVRCELFSREPMFTVNDAKSIAQLDSLGLNVVDDGKRVSGTFVHASHAISVAGTLSSVLLEVERGLLNMESCNDEHAMGIDAKIDAKITAKMTKPEMNVDTNVVADVAEDTKEVEQEPEVNGNKPKGLN